MALFDDLSDGLRTVFLAGVGAMAVGAEKSQELIEELVKRGELTVEQGRSINEEFARRVRETTDSASDELLRGRFRGMTPEQRAEWIARAQRIAEDLEAEDADYEVDDVPPATADEADAEPAPEPEPADEPAPEPADEPAPEPVDEPEPEPEPAEDPAEEA